MNLIKSAKQYNCPTWSALLKQLKHVTVQFLMETHLRTTGCRLITIWDRTMLLATRHKRTHPALTPAGEGWYSIYRGVGGRAIYGRLI